MSTQYKIAVIDDWSKIAKDCANWKLIEPYGKVDIYYDNLTDLQSNINRLKPYSIIVCMRNRTIFNKQLLSQLPNLKLLATTGPGNRTIDIEHADKMNITIVATDHPAYGNLKAFAPAPTAQLVWAYILEYYRKVNAVTKQIKHNPDSWYPIGINNQPLNLSTQTLGCIGLGRIGSVVAKVGVTFGMKVIGWSFHLTQERCDKIDCRIICENSLNELMTKSDIVVIALPLVRKTKHLIDSTRLKCMKKNALLINISRGHLVKESDLIDALHYKQIGGVALDVFHEEPLPKEHYFRSMHKHNENVMLTPHQGGFTQGTYKLWYRNCVENILAFINNTPIRVITPQQRVVQENAHELALASKLYNKSKL
eukprot:456181_1